MGTTCRPTPPTSRHPRWGADRSTRTPSETAHTPLARRYQAPATREQADTGHSGGRTYLRALDHLGHLAADPLDRDGSAESARDRLVDLARFGTTAADAAVRLPVHLVGEEQAELLLDHYEQRRTLHRELVDEDGTGPSEFADRESMVIRTVLFQIKDAERLRQVVAA